MPPSKVAALIIEKISTLKDLNNNQLLDSDVTLVKQAERREIKRGQKVPFTLRVGNRVNRFVGPLTVTDVIPTGFRYVAGSATVDGVVVSPVVMGQRVRFEDLVMAPNTERVIRLKLQALSTAGPGKHVNKAIVMDQNGQPVSPEAQASVEITVEPVFLYLIVATLLAARSII